PLVLGPFERCRYYRGDAGNGAQLHLCLGLQAVPAILDELSTTATRVTPDRPVAYGPGESAYLLDLSVGAGPRIFGRARTLASP
ncbi:MAG: hypothetical protein ABSB97_08720, partial [Thermoplasmata archaeon]